RAGVLSSLRCVVRWLEKAAVWVRDPRDRELTDASIAQIFRSLTPGPLGISRKRLCNAKSDLRFALRFFVAPHSSFATPATSVSSLEQLVHDRFAKMTLGPFLR